MRSNLLFSTQENKLWMKKSEIPLVVIMCSLEQYLPKNLKNSVVMNRQQSLRKIPDDGLCLRFCRPCQVKPFVCHLRTPPFVAGSLEGARVKEVDVFSQWTSLSKD